MVPPPTWSSCAPVEPGPDIVSEQEHSLCVGKEPRQMKMVHMCGLGQQVNRSWATWSRWSQGRLLTFDLFHCNLNLGVKKSENLNKLRMMMKPSRISDRLEPRTVEHRLWFQRVLHGWSKCQQKKKKWCWKN